MSAHTSDVGYPDLRFPCLKVWATFATLSPWYRRLDALVIACDDFRVDQGFEGGDANFWCVPDINCPQHQRILAKGITKDLLDPLLIIDAVLVGRAEPPPPGDGPFSHQVHPALGRCEKSRGEHKELL